MSGSPTPVVDMSEGRSLECGRCGRRIDECALCQDPACLHVICYHCLRQELGQSLSQPHGHGG
jgi:hypothetical protein